MTWTPLLLADRSVCLRWLVLRELLGRPDDDPEMLELEVSRLEDPLVAELFTCQGEDGSWRAGVDLSLGGGEDIRITAMVLRRLAFCGFNKEHTVVERGAEYLFKEQGRDGSFPLRKIWGAGKSSDNYDMVPLQTAIPLASLAMCGYAQDKRVERGYDWLLSQRLEDGAWPTGRASGVYGYPAGYRRLAHSRWGCRSNTTGSLLCLSLHPELKSSPELKQALDLLLAQERFEVSSLGFEAARLIGIEKSGGFITFFARSDPALLMVLCSRIGATREDERVDELVENVLALQGAYGMWDYASHPGASRWVTFDILHTLRRLDDAGDWTSMQPRIPFDPYPKIKKRF